MLSMNNRRKSVLFFLILICCGLLSFNNYLFSQTDNKSNENSVSVFNSLNYWSLSRNYPFNKIPSNAFLNASKYSSANLNNKLNKINAPDPWKSIGPNNIGGRTLCITLNPMNPETVYAGSAGGGLWRSYTGGVGAEAWHYVSTGFPVLAVSAIAIDPSDTNKIYVGTGEVYNLNSTGTGFADKLTIGSYGIGIIKTSDGGLTWEQSLSWNDSLQVGVSDIKIDSFNKNVIWAATTEGTYKNLFYGGTEFWYRVHDVKMATELVISPTNPNRVYVACGNLGSENNGLYKTENGGQSWSNTFVFPSTIPTYIIGKGQIAVSESNPNIFFATLGYGDYINNKNTATWTYKTDNNGAFWITKSVSNWASINGWYSHDIAINPQNPEEIFVGGIYLWKSIDGGSTFKQQDPIGKIFPGDIKPGEPEGDSNYVHQNIHQITYNIEDPQIIYFATDGGVFRTTDGGNTFEGCNGGYQTSNFNDGFSISQNNKDFIIAGAQGNGTNIYNGSNAWRKYILPFDGGYTAINSLNDNIVYASYQNLNVFKSNNKGNSFGQLNIANGFGRKTAYIAPFVIGFINSNIIYAGRDKIYKSFDGGNTWFESNKGGVLDGNPIVKMAISPKNDDVVICATFPLEQKDAGVKAGLFRTGNGGDTWEDITLGLPDRAIGDVYFDNNSWVYVTFLGFGSSHLFRSTNLGQSWTNIGTALPDVPTSAVIVDPANSTNLYVGNDLGVYYSSNSGINWEKFSSGLPNAVMVTDLKIFVKDRLIRVSTNGSGFFERKLATEPSTSIVEQSINNDFVLYQNYPNPFNPITKIKFTIPNFSPNNFTQLKVYDVLGNEISTLINAEYSEGSYEVEFNGSGLASGVYYYKLISGTYSESKKMLLLK